MDYFNSIRAVLVSNKPTSLSLSATPFAPPHWTLQSTKPLLFGDPETILLVSTFYKNVFLRPFRLKGILN
jgi:hypothetical protein